jgi:uncharacterized membrane protein
MTRAAFLARLREGLRGLPAQTINEAVVDYDTHFTDGISDGRSEEDIARGLGDPGRLARELRAELVFKKYEEQPNAAGAAGAVFALLGLSIIDLILLVPLFIIALVIVVFYAVNIGGFVAGIAAFTALPFMHPPGGPMAAILLGLGFMAGAVSNFAILTLISIAIIKGVVWFGRMQFRLLKPEPETQRVGGAS